MTADAQTLRRRLIKTTAERIIAHAEELTALDQAIGDGDHGINMKRGLEAVLADLDKLAEKPLGEALKAAGMHLVTKVGGASGPLYGTLFMSLGKGLADIPDRAQMAGAFRAAVDAVKARGKSDFGMKTMLDVLGPVAETLEGGGSEVTAALRQRAADAVAATKPLQAIRGRASFLGERSKGHVDPGRALEPADGRGGLRRHRGPGMSQFVGIVIVSHSPDVARGAAAMVRQMVGEEVPCAFTGGNPAGELGTDPLKIRDAIESVWSEAGVAVFVDLGGAEMNAEMAVEMLDAARGEKVRICNAPVVEGAVIAASEAAGGSTLEQVCATAEELSP